MSSFGKSFSLLFILIFLIAMGTISFLPIKAQTQSFFVINADGSVSPLTPLIKQTDNIYTFTNDIDTTVLTVQKSNIILDGNGHNINRGIIQINSVANVTVKNVSISNTGSVVIAIEDSTNVVIVNNSITGGVTPFGMIGGISIINTNLTTITGNAIKNDMFGILLLKSYYNQIIGNNLTDISNSWGYYSAGIILDNSSNNTIYYNHFINNDHGAEVDSGLVNTWDNGKVGNYWSDYQSKYPNATEIDNSGTGNMPYVINASNTDNYPLIHPVNINATIPTPTAIPNQPNEMLIQPITIAGAVLVVAFTSLLLFRRNRKKANLNT
jgi:parallel beta-helix repeat protein